MARNSGKGLRAKSVSRFTLNRIIPVARLRHSTKRRSFPRAAVAGVSASQPLPPLPSEYHGNQIMLQLVFAYNVPVN